MFESLFTFLFKYRPLMFDEGRVAFDVPVSIVALLVVGGLVAAAAAFTYARVGGKATRAGATVPRLTTEVQPWRIDSVHGSAQTFTVTLRDRQTRRVQRVQVRRSGEGWTVVAIDVM